MARHLIEAQLNSRSARRALRAGIYGRRIDATTHLGYRNGTQGGRWIVRWFDQKIYRTAVLGAADDVIVEGNLSFDAAVKKAVEHVADVKRGAKAASRITIREAAEVYIAIRDRRASTFAGRPVKSDAHSRLNKHFLSDPELAKLPLRALTEQHLSKWRKRLPPSLKATSRQRLFSDIKAALNAAGKEHRKSLPPDFLQIVKYGLSVEDEPDIMGSRYRSPTAQRGADLALQRGSAGRGTGGGRARRAVASGRGTDDRDARAVRSAIRITLSPLLRHPAERKVSQQGSRCPARHDQGLSGPPRLGHMIMYHLSCRRKRSR